MFKLTDDTLQVILPEGKTQEELISLAKEEIDVLLQSKAFVGKDIKIDGRITTALSLFLGHRLAHACNSVSVYDPKIDKFVKAVWH